MLIWLQLQRTRFLASIERGLKEHVLVEPLDGTRTVYETERQGLVLCTRAGPQFCGSLHVLVVFIG